MMRIKLEFVHPKPPSPSHALVRRPGTDEGIVIGMLCTDLVDTRVARKFRDELRDVVARKLHETAGWGNAYLKHATADGAIIQMGDWKGSPSVELPTADLLDAVEQWLAFLEREYGERPFVG
jgi:hypothetical protein